MSEFADTYIQGGEHPLEKSKLLPDVLDRMAKEGGSFVRCLSLACHHADAVNRRLLLNTFHHYFSEYYQRVLIDTKGKGTKKKGGEE